ncbi:MAG: AMIN domain-containing protein [Myxococcales bacterium]|nr:AMIN domain-containing protein [Myxococcales bacterium]
MRSIETAESGRAREVRIGLDGPVEHSVFHLSEPFKILVDLSGASFADGLETIAVDDGVIRRIHALKLKDGGESTTRIEVELFEPRSYRTVADGGQLVLRIDAEERASPLLGKLRPKKSRGELRLVAPLRGSIAPENVRLEALESPARLVVDLEDVKVDPRFQTLAVDALGVKRARVADKAGSVRIVLDMVEQSALPEVAVTAVENELRIVVTGAKRSPASVAAPTTSETTKTSSPIPATADASAIRPADAGPDLALEAVVDEPPTMVAADPRKDSPRPGTEVQDTLRSKGAREISPPIEGGPATAEPAPLLVETDPSPPAAATAAASNVIDVRFEPKDGFVRFTVVLDRAGFEVVKAGEGKSPHLFLPGVTLPKRFERTLDVAEASSGALSGISTFNAEGGVVVAAGIHDETEHRHWTKGEVLMWDFRSSSMPKLARASGDATAGYRSAGLALGDITPAQRRYRGRRISLDLKDADIQNVLRLLADVSKLNIVAGEEVQGKVTIKLRNVPWDQALDIILSSRQLDKVRNGNIIRVAPTETLQAEEELRLKRREAQQELEPLKVRLIPVSYAVAQDIRPQVQALLSSRGKVNIDERTNVLIVEDIEEALVKVERLVRTLDTQTPQVLIESRIVEARSNFSRELGIQWGGTVNFTQQFGTQTGLDFPYNFAISGGADAPIGNQTAGVSPTPNYAVNLPAAVGAGGGGSLGFVLGSVDGSALINLRLSAAEAVGKVRLVSAPRS